MGFIGESIVNPRCDECNAPLSTPKIGEIGFPRLCFVCKAVIEAEYQERLKDYVSQERPRGRTIHKIKLPPGGLK